LFFYGILENVPIGRLVEPEEVASLIGNSIAMRPWPETFSISTEACVWDPRASRVFIDQFPIQK
jgi:hypothetical protein